MEETGKNDFLKNLTVQLLVIGFWFLVDNYKWVGTGKTNN